MRQRRCALGDDSHRRQIVRLVQRRQRHERIESRQDFGVDPHRRAELLAAVHDAVADGGERALPLLLLDEVEHVGNRAGVAERVAIGPVAPLYDPVLRVVRDECRRRGQALDLAAQQPPRTGGAAGVQA